MVIRRDESGRPVAPPERDRWFVELLLDSGQRIASIDMTLAAARIEAANFASRMRVMMISTINADTGEARVKLSRSFMAALDSIERDPGHYMLARSLQRLIELSAR